MIKVVGLLTRRPEYTHEQFVKHWLEIRASRARGAGHPALRPIAHCRDAHAA